MTYLFLAVAPFTGSTILHNYLAKCDSVVALTFPHKQDIGVIEGNSAIQKKGYHLDYEMQKKNYNLDSLPILFGCHISALQNPVNYGWDSIKAAWDENWESSSKEAPIRLQKTPADLYRLQLMQPYFDAKWIISVRNPYAYAQSIIEELLQRKVKPQDHVEKIVAHIVNTYTAQNENKDFLGASAYVMTYEDFVANEDKHTAGIKAFLPELYDLTFKGSVRYKHTTATGLVDNNAKHIETFKSIPGAVSKFNALFKPYEKVINSWGYELL